MQAVHGVLGEQPGLKHWLRHLMSFAETLLDKLLAASGRYRFANVRLEGQEQVDALVAQGRGALLVTAHVGCLELCQALAARLPGLRLDGAGAHAPCRALQRILRRLDPASRVELLQVTEVTAATAVELERRVRAASSSRSPATACRSAAAAIATVPFLGAPAAVPGRGLRACLAAGLPLVAGGMHPRRQRARRALRAAGRKLRLPRADRAQALQQWAALFAQRLEALLVRSPYDWFNFFPFWA